jgi:hypothetical protein
MKKHSPFRYFKTSLEIIRLAVMMYVRFPLSLRNVEDLLHERGSTSATKRCGSGGTDLARCLPRRFEENGFSTFAVIRTCSGIWTSNS